MAKSLSFTPTRKWFPPGREELAVLARIKAELIAVECRTEEQVMGLASSADAILNSRARISALVLR